MNAPLPLLSPARLRQFALWVLVGWSLALGAAVAAPLLRAADDLCRSPDAAPLSQAESGMHCAACLPAVAPPPADFTPLSVLPLPQPLMQRPGASEIPESYLGTALARGPPASF